MNAPRDWTLSCLSCGAVVAFSRLFSLYTSVPCTGVPGPKIHQYPGAWVPRHTTVPRIQSPTQKTYSYTRKVKIATRSEKSATTRKVAGKSSEKARKFQQNAFLGSRRHWVLGTGYWVLGTQRKHLKSSEGAGYGEDKVCNYV